MIPANELRIGNMVNVLNQIVTVTEISGFKDRICIESDRNIVIDLENVQPISLTSEILEQSGFEKLTNCFTRPPFAIEEANDNGFLISISGKDLCTIWYLHQLQNIIFFLTGQELEIDITEKVKASE